MSLLREIQDAAIDADVPLASLLRKCKVLAARLGNDKFNAWVDHELNGYDSRDDLPEYRVLQVHSKGHFAGAFQRTLQNADIPMSCIPEELREGLSHAYLMVAVAAIEDLLTGNESGVLREPWNPDVVAFVGDKIYQNMHCMQAWKVIPRGAVVAAIDTIRNKVLNFVLEVEAAAPSAGEAPLNSSPLPQERVRQIFNTHIYGDVQNLANASPGAQQNATYYGQNRELFRDLVRAIELSGAPNEITVTLVGHVKSMGSAADSRTFRQAYLQFMSVLSDHAQVFGGALAPFLSRLAELLT